MYTTYRRIYNIIYSEFNNLNVTDERKSCQMAVANSDGSSNRNELKFFSFHLFPFDSRKIFLQALFINDAEKFDSSRKVFTSHDEQLQIEYLNMSILFVRWLYILLLFLLSNEMLLDSTAVCNSRRRRRKVCPSDRRVILFVDSSASSDESLFHRYILRSSRHARRRHTRIFCLLCIVKDFRFEEPRKGSKSWIRMTYFTIFIEIVTFEGTRAILPKKILSFKIR